MSERAFVETCLGTLVRIEHGWPFESARFSEQLTGRPIVVAVGNFQYTGGFRFASTTLKEYTGEYPREFELKPGDILLVMTCQTPGGEILGIPARIPDDGRLYLHNQRLGKVVLKRPDLADLDFLYYVFLSRDFNDELVASSTGTKIVHTAPSRIEAFRFRLPPLDVQRSIASLLKALDQKIDSNRTVNVAVETLAAAVFKSWFIDFDPVMAKRDCRTPVGVPAEALDLFPSHFEESELGPIPRGWRVVPLSELAEINARTLSGKELPPEIQYIEISDRESRRYRRRPHVLARHRA